MTRSQRRQGLVLGLGAAFVLCASISIIALGVVNPFSAGAPTLAYLAGEGAIVALIVCVSLIASSIGADR